MDRLIAHEVGNTYGPTEVSGGATALLGNKYILYQIQQANFVRGSETAEHEHSFGGKKRSHYEIDRHVEHHHGGSSYCHCDHACDGQHCAQGSASHPQCKRTRLNNIEPGRQFKQRSGQAITSLFSNGSWQTPGNAESTYLSILNTKQSNTIPTSSTRLAAPRSTDSKVGSSATPLNTAVPIAIATILFCRNVSLEALCKTLAQAWSDPVFPLVTGITGYWLSCLLQCASLRWRPSELGSETTTFDDIYGIRREIPRSYLDSEEVLLGFFAAHYKGTSAQNLVADKQYNLMTEGRSRWPLSLTTLCYETRMGSWPGIMFMSLRYRASSSTCLDCTNRLAPSTLGSIW